MTATTSGRPPALAWVLLVTLGIIWGCSFLLTKIAVEGVPPLTLVALRLTLAGALIAIYTRAVTGAAPRVTGPIARRLVPFAMAAAIAGNIVPFTLIAWAQQHIPSALTGLLMAPMPLFALALSHFLIAGESMTGRKLIGFLIGLGGLVVLIGPDALGQLGRGDMLSLMAQLATLTAALCYAISAIILKRAAAPDPMGVSIMILSFAAMAALPAALLIEGWTLSAAGWRSVAAAIALGIGATAIGQILLMKILSMTGPPFLSLVNYQVPLWAVVFGVTLMGETLPATFWPALLMILVGVAIAQMKGKRAGA
ncbi:MAG: DMT family transporter [Pikeienuella sp.]